jgi:hypothetical protein
MYYTLFIFENNIYVPSCELPFCVVLCHQLILLVDPSVRLTLSLINPSTWIRQYDYPTFIGGILLISRAQYSQVDGMSNKYWGWGLEDDEFFVRYRNLIITTSVADPDTGSGAFLTPRWIENQDPDPGIQDEHPGSKFRVKNT